MRCSNRIALIILYPALTLKKDIVLLNYKKQYLRPFLLTHLPHYISRTDQHNNKYYNYDRNDISNQSVLIFK